MGQTTACNHSQLLNHRERPPSSAVLQSVLVSFSSLSWFYGPAFNQSFSSHGPRRQKVLNALPAQHQTTKRQCWQLASEHTVAFNSRRSRFTFRRPKNTTQTHLWWLCSLNRQLITNMLNLNQPKSASWHNNMPSVFRPQLCWTVQKWSKTINQSRVEDNLTVSH